MTSRRPEPRGEPPGKRARTEWETWRVVELKEECRARGLKPQGRKADLINLLLAHSSPEPPQQEEEEEGEDREEEDSSLYMSLSPVSGPPSPSPSPPPSPPLARRTVTELRQRCRDQGLSDSGRKAALIERLEQARARQGEADTESDSSESGGGEDETHEGTTSPSPPGTCSHITPDSVQRRHVEKIALNPVRWKCQTCGTTESVYVCLTCAQVGCGRHVRGHAHKHARSSGHVLVIEVNTAITFCHTCDRTVTDDTPAQDIAQLRQCLRGLRTIHNDKQPVGAESDLHDDEESQLSDSTSDMDSSVDGPLPRAKLRRRASQFIMRAVDHDIEDCFETSQAHYRNNVLARPFHAWKQFIDHRRRQVLAQLLESDEEDEEEDEEADVDKSDSLSPLELSGVSTSSREDFTPSLSQDSGQEEKSERAPLSWLSRTKTLQLSQSFSLDESAPVPRFQPRKPVDPSPPSSPGRSRVSSRTQEKEPSTPPRRSEAEGPPSTRGTTRTPRLPGLSRTSSSSVLIAPGQTGLRNLGNSCFMNAVIQALSSLVELRRFFIHQLLPQGRSVPLGNKLVTRSDTSDCLALIHNNKLIRTLEEKEISVCLELHRLMRVIWSGKNAVITPHSLFGAMWALKPTFQGYQQQDAEELLSFLMDKVDEELRESSARTRRASLRFPSIMEKLCQGVLRTTITCEHCGHVSHRQEPFRQLCWPIPEAYVTTGRPRRRATTPTPTCDLNDLFQAWQAPESLSGYRCEECGDTEHSHKNVAIAEAPDILCVVINRFAWSARGRAKINTLVTYPLAWEVPMPPRAPVAYALRSVVRHHGFTLNSGHYTATVYNTVRDLWLDCNDHVIKPLESHQVVPQDNTAYILFYAQHEGAWP